MKRLADIIKSFQKTLLPAGLNIEVDLGPIRRRDDLLGEIDSETVIGAARLGRERLTDLNRQGYGQDAVLVTVIVKDIGKGGRDDAGDALVEQCPWCVLAR